MKTIALLDVDGHNFPNLAQRQLNYSERVVTQGISLFMY